MKVFLCSAQSRSWSSQSGLALCASRSVQGHAAEQVLTRRLQKGVHGRKEDTRPWYGSFSDSGSLCSQG
jgi:hypothetical protein